MNRSSRGRGRTRAWAVATAWIVVGLLVRWRFRPEGCGDVDGAWAMGIYACASLVALIAINARERPAGGADEQLPHRFGLEQRRASWLAALAVVAIGASALVSYARHADACSS